MKYNFELFVFDIKHKKINYIFPLIFLWFIFLPFLINQAQNIINIQGIPILYFDYLQKVIPIIFLYYLYIFFKNFLENESIEATYTMNLDHKIVFLFYILLFYQIILTPFYIVSFYFFDTYFVILELIAFNFILLFLSVLFYCLSYFFVSSIIALGILLFYCFVFMTLFPFISYFNVFHIGEAIINIQNQYYIKHILELLLIIYIGIKNESNIKL